MKLNSKRNGFSRVIVQSLMVHCCRLLCASIVCLRYAFVIYQTNHEICDILLVCEKEKGFEV